eukprot:GHVS01019429.1.p1 GENE.GHVS01019429.1~~GHVS01019429.1.p1  ORF type:complete len:426 (+),score=48.87 GHVS01019429.1:57-1334(+)
MSASPCTLFSSPCSAPNATYPKQLPAVRATKTEKTLGMLTFVCYISVGFYLSRHSMHLLDDITDYLKTRPSPERYHQVVSPASLLFVSPSVALSVVLFYLHGAIAAVMIFIESSVDRLITYAITSYSHLQLATVGTIVMHQVWYWTMSLPDFVFQFFPSVHNYKIQKERDCSKKLQWDCFKNVMFNQWLVETPIIIGNYFFCVSMHYGWDSKSLPRWYQLVASMLGCMATEDCYHYFVHRLMHIYPSLYTGVHKQHHRFVTPMGMQAEYAHPLEIIVLGVGFTLGCSLFCTNFFSTWLWMCVRLLETIEAHSGYDISLYGNLLHCLPFFGGPRFHDFHHSNFIGNYASTFTYWDALFDTDVQYRKATRKRIMDEEEQARSNEKRAGGRKQEEEQPKGDRWNNVESDHGWSKVRRRPQSHKKKVSG